MNTFQLTCFLAVADALNFARAAESLNVTQPAITHQIKSLEAELSVKLFHRTTHTVEFTREGMLFLEDARSIVFAADRAKHRVQDMQTVEFSLLSIGCHIDGYYQALPDVLRKLVAAHPHLHPDVRFAPTQPLLYRLLETGRVDVVLGLREGQMKKAPGVYRELAKTHPVCLCAKDQSLSRRAAVCYKDLQDESLIVFDPTSANFFNAGMQGRLMEGRTPDNMYFAQSTASALMLAKAGCGVFLMPEVFAPDDSAIVTVPLVDGKEISFGMFYKTLQGSPTLRTFATLLRSALSEDGAARVD